MLNRLLALTIVLVFLVVLGSSNKGDEIQIERRSGGLSKVNSVLPQDSAISEMVKQVQSQVFKTMKLALHSNASLKPKFYSTQVVAGTNYFIMVEYAAGKCILLRIHKSLPYAGNKITLIDTKQPKSCAKEDVKYF